MRTSEEIINRYNRLYYKIYKTWPVIVKNRSWVYINDEPKALRLNQMDKKSDFLQARIEERKNIPLKESTRIKRNWRNNLSNDIINLFLDELLRKCGFSLFKTERFMQNFICGGDLSDCKINTDADEFICDPENCDALTEAFERIESIEEECEALKETNNELKNTLIESEESIKVLIEDLDENRKKYKELKKNSVLFSMDDIDTPPIEYVHEDDDIPF